MTRTGYSCEHMARKVKHGCVCSQEHYCKETGKYIDPMSCHKECRLFRAIAENYRRPSPKLETALL